jgi:hypothetical protein
VFARFLQIVCILIALKGLQREMARITHHIGGVTAADTEIAANVCYRRQEPDCSATLSKRF